MLGTTRVAWVTSGHLLPTSSEAVKNVTNGTSTIFVKRRILFLLKIQLHATRVRPLTSITRDAFTKGGMEGGLVCTDSTFAVCMTTCLRYELACDHSVSVNCICDTGVQDEVLFRLHGTLTAFITAAGGNSNHWHDIRVESTPSSNRETCRSPV